MEEKEDINKVYTKKEDIAKILEKIKEYSFEELRKSDHYSISIIEKNTDEDFLKKTFSKFEKIEMILFRLRQNKFNNYDIYYKNEDGTYTLYAINLNEKIPLLLNAYIVNRDFNKFKKQILKRYGKELI